MNRIFIKNTWVELSNCLLFLKRLSSAKETELYFFFVSHIVFGRPIMLYSKILDTEFGFLVVYISTKRFNFVSHLA